MQEDHKKPRNSGQEKTQKLEKRADALRQNLLRRKAAKKDEPAN